MNKIMKFQDYRKASKTAEDFIERILTPTVNESILNDDVLKKILTKLSNDLKFNYGLVFSFGTGIALMYPIVLNLIKNSKLNIELTTENIVLLTLTTLSICYLEENKKVTGLEDIVCNDCLNKDSEVVCKTCNGSGVICTKNDAQNLLAELKLRGIGNGIVKKMKNCFFEIVKLLKNIFKHSQIAVSTLLDMFAYTSLLIPTTNAISWLIDHNKFSMDDLSGNLTTIGAAILSFLSKQGFNYVADEIKKRFGGSYKDIKDIRDGQSDLEKNELIKEQ